MKLPGIFVAGLFLAHSALAGVNAFDYRLGATSVSEDQYRIVIHAQPAIAVDILPGGRSWPALSLDEAGRIYAGGTVIDSATGRVVSRADAALALPHGVEVAVLDERYRFRRGGKECRLSPRQLHLDAKKSALDALKDANLVLASASGTLLVLVTRFGADGAVADYLVERIDIARCRVVAPQRLGNPDLLVELARSERGGWWIAGSVEQTLLRSRDGRHWRKVSLPAGLSSLVSAHVTNEREIWLAAALPQGDGPSPHLLVYSDDGGKRWRNLKANDPLLARLPAAWLEGQKRRTP
ncbi:hypothetical protein HUX88_15955 [Duganella sp. BJB1802]|uniref:WD40/YVTN/BNR-like repeat-containing protein n=1 Tax=Duganella sp. BJB1802 TaxID=2744575 RepID=UPI0015939A0D|nr:hypothetical protein [Duganella sp. BJB1802]NVD72036.1 hypothetical protein [Duganella sp. BJB1802]